MFCDVISDNLPFETFLKLLINVYALNFLLFCIYIFFILQHTVMRDMITHTYVQPGYEEDTQ